MNNSLYKIASAIRTDETLINHLPPTSYYLPCTYYLSLTTHQILTTRLINLLLVINCLIDLLLALSHELGGFCWPFLKGARKPTMTSTKTPQGFGMIWDPLWRSGRNLVRSLWDPCGILVRSLSGFAESLQELVNKICC